MFTITVYQNDECKIEGPETETPESPETETPETPETETPDVPESETPDALREKVTSSKGSNRLTKEDNRTLPQTGEVASLGIMSLGTIISSLSGFFISRRNRK